MSRAEPIPQRHLPILRFALANLVALALVGAAAGQGRTPCSRSTTSVRCTIVGVFLLAPRDFADPAPEIYEHPGEDA